MRTAIGLLMVLAPTLVSQTPAPRFLYVYRDSLRSGVDSAYRAIENDGAQICADRRCPNPYIGMESLTGPHEAWWINAFASEADTARVAHVYATDRALSDALGAIAQRKAALIGTPVQGFAVYRRDFSRGRVWTVAGARFVVALITHRHSPADGSVWVAGDSTLYILRAFRTLQQAQAAAQHGRGRVFAIRPNWSMPAADWVASDPAFWRAAPSRAHNRP